MLQAMRAIRRLLINQHTENNRILFCRPRGGLNDTLNQIHKCKLYSDKFNRELWVDTSRSGLKDSLANYFKPTKHFKFGVPISSSSELGFCYPDCISKDYRSYQSIYVPSDNYVETNSRSPLTFDFNTDYGHDILVHEQCGGGSSAIRALRLLQLRKEIGSMINDAISSLGEYDAIHVRNTDLATDYRAFFLDIESEVNRKVVLCTDDNRCQQYAKNFWGDRLILIHDVPATGGRSLHESELFGVDKFSLNVDSILDLFILACCRNLYSRSTNEGVLSGFVILAENLRKRPRVTRKLLNLDC